MKILHLITGLKIGGAESVLVNFLSQPMSSKHEHVVAYFRGGPNVAAIQALGIPTYHITGLVYAYDPVAYFRLKKLVATVDPDVIHASLWSANIFGRLIGYQLGVPVVCSLHGSAGDEGRLRNAIDRLTIHRAQAIVAVSPSTGENYDQIIIAQINDVQRENDARSKLCVIHNGIDAESLRKAAKDQLINRQEIGCDDQDFIIGAVGRLEPIKSYHVLIEAFALLYNKQRVNQKYKRLVLCLVGDGSERASLEKLARERGIDGAVRFLGQRNDAYRLYQLFDCFALSSQSEGLSVALLEALSFGLPIVTTNTRAEHDVIEQGVHGFVVSINQPEQLADALEWLYVSPELCMRMRQANLRLVETRFTLAANVASHYKLYADLRREKHICR